MPKRLTQEEFIFRSIKIHGDRYDYSEVKFINCSTKVKIICNECHNAFYQGASHYRVEGCPNCATTKKLTQELAEVRVIKHGHQLKFGKFISTSDLWPVTCLICGHSWSPIAGNLMHQGSGCPVCNARKLTPEKVASRIQKLSPNIEVLGEYQNDETNLLVRCKGCQYEWAPAPKKLFEGSGCPNCKSSYAVKKLQEFLKASKIKFIREKKFQNCRLHRPLAFDFYLLDYNLIIEVDGAHHQAPMSYGGQRTKLQEIENFENVQLRDAIKTQYCKDHQIKLLRLLNEEIHNGLHQEMLRQALNRLKDL